MIFYSYFIWNFLPYFILLVVVFVLCFFKFNKFNLRATVVLIFIFSAIRYNVGYDYVDYYHAIEYEMINSLYRFEPIQKLIVYLSQATSFTPLFFIINSFITIFFLYKGLKILQLEDMGMSLFLYVCFPLFYIQSFSVIRFMSALSVAFCAFAFLQKKRHVISLLLIIAAINLHYSSGICLLFFLFDKLKISRNINVILLIFSFFVSFYMEQVLLKITSNNQLIINLQNYAQYGDTEAFGVLPYILQLFNVLNLIFYNKLTMYDERSKKYIFFYSIGCFFMQVFSFEPTLSSRLSRFFLVFLILIIPYYKYLFKDKIVFRFITFLLFAILFTQQFIINTLSFLKGLSFNSYFPYQTIFNI